MIVTFFKALKDQNVEILDTLVTNDFRASFIDNLFFGEASKTHFLDWAKKNKYVVNNLLVTDNFVTFVEKDIEKGARFKTVDGKIKEYSEYLINESKRYVATVSYNGQNYFGYQRQNEQITVQGTIEAALSLALKETIEINASGRTDRGVHAVGQVIHFDSETKIPVEKMLKIINAHLPLDIKFLTIKEVSKAFHARYDVIGKEYVYKINTNPYNPIDSNLYWYVEPFDINVFTKELNKVIGEHDFYAFCKRPMTPNTIRTITSVDVRESNKVITVSVKGNGFLRHMVRFIIGAAVMIASKKVSYSMDEVFDKNDNQTIKDLAQPSGLYLNNVYYEE